MGRGEFLEFDKGKAPIEENAQEHGEAALRDHNFFLERGRQAMYAADAGAALRYFSRALDQHLQLEEAWVGQCLALLDMGEFDEAAIWAQRAMEHCPGSGPCFALRAVANARMGFIDKANGFLESAMKTKKDHWVHWLSRAEVLLISDRISNVDYSVRKALEAGGAPKWWMLRRAGEMSLLHDQPMMAITYFLKALEFEPNQPMNFVRMAQAYIVIGKKDEARRHVERALALKPGMEQAGKLMGKINNMGFFDSLWKRIAGK